MIKYKKILNHLIPVLRRKDRYDDCVREPFDKNIDVFYGVYDEGHFEPLPDRILAEMLSKKKNSWAEIKAIAMKNTDYLEYEWSEMPSDHKFFASCGEAGSAIVFSKQKQTLGLDEFLFCPITEDFAVFMTSSKEPGDLISLTKIIEAVAIDIEQKTYELVTKKIYLFDPKKNIFSIMDQKKYYGKELGILIIDKNKDIAPQIRKAATEEINKMLVKERGSIEAVEIITSTDPIVQDMYKNMIDAAVEGISRGVSNGKNI